MKNAVLLAIKPKITLLQEILWASGKPGVFGRKSGVKAS